MRFLLNLGSLALPRRTLALGPAALSEEASQRACVFVSFTCHARRSNYYLFFSLETFPKNVNFLGPINRDERGESTARQFSFPEQTSRCSSSDLRLAGVWLLAFLLLRNAVQAPRSICLSAQGTYCARFDSISTLRSVRYFRIFPSRHRVSVLLGGVQSLRSLTARERQGAVLKAAPPVRAPCLG